MSIIRQETYPGETFNRWFIGNKQYFRGDIFTQEEFNIKSLLYPLNDFYNWWSDEEIIERLQLIANF